MKPKLPKGRKSNSIELKTCAICKDVYPAEGVTFEVVLDGETVKICDECAAQQSRLAGARRLDE